MLTNVLYLLAYILFITFIGLASYAIVNVSLRNPGVLFNYLMLLITSASIVSIVTSNRVLKVNDTALTNATATTDSSLFAKTLLISAVAYSGMLCVAWIFKRKNDQNNYFRYHQRSFKFPRDIITAFIVFYIAFSLLPVFFGKTFYFHISLIYPFFVYLALLLWAQFSEVDPVVVVKRCLGSIVCGSLILAVLIPQLALQPGYSGLVPILGSRLWGATASANTLGSVASALLLIEAAEPSARRWVNFSMLLAATVALIMTQSKTSIIAAASGLLILFCWRFYIRLRDNACLTGRNYVSIIISIFAFTGLLFVIAVWVLAYDLSVHDIFGQQITARASHDLTTATGRTWIWTIAIRGGLESPLFGQGANFWNFVNSPWLGLSGAVHAHNLFLQVFSRSGLVGLIALLIFLSFFLSYSIRASNITRGGSIAVVVVFLVRAIFEVPLQPNSILGGEFFAATAFFFYSIDRGARARYEDVVTNQLLSTFNKQEA